MTVETDKAWGTMPLFGIYLRLQPLAEGGFLSIVFPIFKFYLARTSPLKVKPMACTDKETNFKVYALLHTS